MKCTTCGNETQPGAKFCVHCGTTIVAPAAPAGMAPLAAPSVTPRAPSPSAVPAASTSATASRPAYTPPPPTASAAAVSAQVAPATSMRLGLLAGVLALFAVIGIGSFVAYKMLFPAVPKESVTTTDANKAADGTPAAGPDGRAQRRCRARGCDRGGLLRQQYVITAIAGRGLCTRQRRDRYDSASGRVEGRGGTEGRRREDQGRHSEQNRYAAGAQYARSSAHGLASASGGGARAAAPAPQTDRWEQMRLAYEACNKESFLDRLACNSRVGQQYCKGYWGTVPQCPAGAYGDRGNN